MKLIELVNARNGLGKLVRQDLPLRTAYRLMKITDECNKHLEFYGNELAKCGEDKDRIAELDSMEIDPIEKVEIALDESLLLSASDIKMLSPIVDFCGGD